MAKQPTEKVHEKGKGPPSGQAQGEKKPKPKPSPEAAEKAKAKADKGKEKDKEKEAAALEKEKAPKAPPRPPADPRLKVLKKFHGKFLPRGPLRDRLKVLMVRWNSGEDHGGVTAEELKSLYDDWKLARQKPAAPRPNLRVMTIAAGSREQAKRLRSVAGIDRLGPQTAPIRHSSFCYSQPWPHDWTFWSINPIAPRPPPSVSVFLRHLRQQRHTLIGQRVTTTVFE